MTEISVETKAFGTDDRPWLIGEASGPQAPTISTKQIGLIDFTQFTANTHYPNGYIPSGTCVGVLTSGGRVGPYNDSLSNGLQSNAGHLYNAIRVPTNTATKVAVTVVDAFARISVSRLPANSGLDTAGRADLPLIRYDA